MKSRTIVFLFELAQRWLYFVFDYLDVTSYLFVILYAALIYENFKYAEAAYHYFIEELFFRNEQRFERLSSGMASYFDANWRTWFDYCIKAIVNLFQVFISFLPESVQPILNMFVSTAGSIAKATAGPTTDDSVSESDVSSTKGD
jgi:hypothetical protein